MSDGSSRVAPPPVGNTLEGAGAAGAWAKAFGKGERIPIARTVASARRVFFNTIDIGFPFMITRVVACAPTPPVNA